MILSSCPYLVSYGQIFFLEVLVSAIFEARFSLSSGIKWPSTAMRWTHIPAVIASILSLHPFLLAWRFIVAICGDCFKQSYTPMFLQYIILCLILNQKKNTQFPAGSFFHAFYGTKAKAKGRESICTGHVDTPFQLSSTSAQCDHCCLGPETLLQTGFPC